MVGEDEEIQWIETKMTLHIVAMCLSALGIVWSVREMIADGGGGELCLVAFCCAALTAGFAYLTRKCIKEIKKRRQSIQAKREEKAEQQRRQNEKNILAQKGALEISAEKFYNSCKEAHITSFDDEFSQTKAIQIINEMLGDEEILPENRTLYLHLDYIERCFHEGEEQAKASEKARLEASKTPRNATPNEDEGIFLQRVMELSSLSGNQKRIKMLQNLEGDCQTHIKKKKEGQEAMRQLGQIYLGAQKKEASWGLSGGIAEGIAGPAAGVIAAAQTIENNRKVQQYNQSMREASAFALRGSLGLNNDICELESELSEIQKKEREAEKKVTLQNPSADEILANLKIGGAKIEKSKTGVLHIELPVSVKTPFELSAPEEVIMVVDGTLSGEVWMEDKIIGSVLIPLPLYGIPTNMMEKVTLDAMCDRYVEYEGKYTVKLAETQNLWIMEA